MSEKLGEQWNPAEEGRRALKFRIAARQHGEGTGEGIPGGGTDQRGVRMG